MHAASLAAVLALAPADDPSAWTIHVTNDSCPDYTWGYTEEETRRAFADIVRGHLDEMTRTDAERPEDRSRYNMAVTQEALCFVERYPGRKDELIRRIREGRICVSPFLCNSLWGFQSVEGAVRTLYPARRLERDWKIPIDVAEHIELPSLPWGMATILAGCGIRWISNPFLAYDSTFGGLRNPPLFILEGPDGSALRVVMDPWASNKWSYTQGSHILREPKAILGEWIPRYAGLGDAYPIRAILASGTHGDTSPASGGQARGFAEAIIRYNASADPHPTLVNSTLQMFCDEVDRAEAVRPFLPRLRGCFGHSWELWPVSLAKYVADMREGERAFLSAEALIATAMSRDPRAAAETRADRERAEWCLAMLSDHAWNGSNDENRKTNAELRRRWSEELNSLAAKLQAAGWQAAGIRDDPATLTLFNPISVPRAELVRLPLDGRMTVFEAQHVDEEDGRFAYCVSRKVEGFAYDDIYARAGASPFPEPRPFRATPTELDGPFYRLRIDPATGGIASIVHKASGAEILTAPTGPALSGVRIRVAAEGSVLARLSIEGTEGDATVRTYVTIYARIDRVDIDVRIRKPATPKPERICHIFPILREGAVLRVDTTGAVIRPKPQPEGDLLPGADPKRFAVQGFIDASLPDGPGVTIAPLDAFCLRLDLDPITFEALGNDQNEKEVTRDQNGVTDFRFRYALRGHAGGYDGAEAFAWSRSAATPLLVARGRVDAGRLPRLAAPVAWIDPTRAIATCLKPADDPAAGGCILRVCETSGRSGPLAIRLGVTGKAIRTDLLERDADPLPIVDRRATIDLRAHGLAGVRFLPPEGGSAAILRERDMPTRGTASSPNTIAAILLAAGTSVRFLSASEFADPRILDPEVFDFAVIPTGESFPAEARESFARFLRSGGGFISMGGYAFNHLVRKVDGRWIREEDHLAAERERATMPERSLIAGGSFEGGPAPGGTCAIVSEEPKEGSRAARIDVSEGAVPLGAQAWFEIPAKPGASYEVSGWMRTRDVNGDGMAYIALYQYDEKGELVTFRDFAKTQGTTPWIRYSFGASPAPRVSHLSIRFGLYNAHGTAWFDHIRLCDITGLRFEPMNTSTGVPADGLEVSPAQMGLFDPSYRLKRSVRIRAASGQCVTREPIDLKGRLEGWAASGVVGSDDGRWIPLIDAYDRYDRVRGAAAALLIHYRGFYAGSTWAYFGIEDRDLFADAKGPMARVLQDVARVLARRVFLRNLATEMRLYKPGENVSASVVVENRGRLRRSLEVHFDHPGGQAKVVRSLAPGASERVEARFDAPAPDRDVHRVDATLFLDGEAIDRMSTGFVVESEERIRSGSPLRFENNYFALGGRPLFLFGSDTYSEVYRTASENPLTWAEELRAARDVGMNLYENLQYTNPGHTFSEEEWGAFRAIAQLTQIYGLVFMPGILIGHNVAVDDARLAEESALCAEYARRLRDIPGLLYYINGDYQLRLDRDPPAGVDRTAFEIDLARRWNEAHVAAIRAEDTHHPITSEYYQKPYGGLDLVRTIDGLDVSNFGYFDEPGADIDGLPEAIRRNDLRARGKGVSLGEYGVKTHPAWSRENGATGYHIARSEAEQHDLFLAVAHYALGMGACKVQNWCLRDSQARVFPWGIFHPNRLIPKDIAFVHRNLSIVWRHLAPRYDPARGADPVRARPEESWLPVMRQATAKGNAFVVYNARKGRGHVDAAIETAAGEIVLRARDRGPALAVVTDDGRVVALESSGAARIRGEEVRRGTGLAAMLALDGQDLRRSGSILAAPFETGTIEVPRAASFSAVAGEFRDGVWTALERIQPEGKGGFVAIDIDEDRATCLILLCEPEAEERWAAHLTRALRHPERIDGF